PRSTLFPYTTLFRSSMTVVSRSSYAFLGAMRSVLVRRRRDSGGRLRARVFFGTPVRSQGRSRHARPLPQAVEEFEHGLNRRAARAPAEFLARPRTVEQGELECQIHPTRIGGLQTQTKGDLRRRAQPTVRHVEGLRVERLRQCFRIENR